MRNLKLKKNEPIPRKVENQDMGKPGFLLSDAELNWLNKYIQQNPNAQGKITRQLSEGNLNYPILLINKNRYAIYKGNEGKALGKGGFGQVKIGQNIKTGEWVSVKIQFVKHTDKMREKEINTESNFAKEHGFLLDKIVTKTKQVKKIYLIQKLIGEGDDLHHHLFVDIDKKKISTFEEKLNIAICTLKELKNKFHDKHILHRDLKPNNIVYDKIKKMTMLIDFGAVVDLHTVPLKTLFKLNHLEKLGDTFYAKTTPKKTRILDENTYFHEKDALITEGYSAPEINNLDKALYSKGSDIYALGVCFYYLITTNKKNERNVVPSTLEFYNLVAKMCNYDPRNRPTAEGALKTLNKIKSEWHHSKTRKPTTPPLSQKLLIKKQDINTENHLGHTPLIQAVSKCQNETVKLLLLNKNIDINKKNKEGYTALMKAIEINNVEAVILLLTDQRIDLTSNKFAFALIRSQAVKKLTDHLVKLKIEQETV